MSNSKYCVITVAVETKEQAATISRCLVMNRLAACVQTTKISSVYVWDGEYREHDELLLLIKTEKDMFTEIEKTVHHLHEYDVPEILCLDVTRGSHDYLRWITDAVSTRSSN